MSQCGPIRRSTRRSAACSARQGVKPSQSGIEPPKGKAYDVRYRQHALLIQEMYGHLDPEGMMTIAKAIAPPSNVHSIVFAYPEMWVATARGAVPAAQQPYFRYDLKALFARDE